MLRRRQIATLASISALGPLAMDMYLPALVEMAHALGVTSREATYTVSIFLLGIAAGQLFAGPLSDRIGRRPMVLGGLAVFGLASVLAGITDSFPALMACRLLQALGACAVLNSSRAIVRDAMAFAGAARIFSQMSLVGGLAPVLGPIVGAWLTVFGTWRLNFHAMALISVLMMIAAYSFLPESRSNATAQQASSEHPVAGYLALIRNPALRFYLLAAGFNSAGFFAYLADSPAIFFDVFHLSPRQYSLLFAINATALVTANQINRFLLRKRNLNQVLRISGRNALVLAGCFGVVALAGGGHLLPFALVLFMMVGGVAPLQANAIAGALSVDGLRAGSAAALFGATTYVTGAIGSWIGGLIYDRTERPLCLLLAACLLATNRAIARIDSTATTRQVA